MTDSDYVQAFDLMWEMFPEPTLLVRRDRTVVAANAAARRMGRTEGERCFGNSPHGGGKHHCRNCKADQALRDRRAYSEVSLDLGGPVTGYWLPLPESDDLYVHFGFGVADLMKSQADSLLAAERG